MSNRIRKMTIRKNKTPHCCGQRMRNKSSYDTENEIFYFCEKCGKEKIVGKCANSAQQSRKGVIQNEHA